MNDSSVEGEVENLEPVSPYSHRSKSLGIRRTRKTSQKDDEASSPEERNRAVKWTLMEDQMLRYAVKTHGEKKWKQISKEMFKGKRTEVQCRSRWKQCLKPGVVKGQWSASEDEKIIECRKQGMVKWSKIATHIPGREGKQCRERWINHLDPSINHGQWTEQEDRILVALQSELGNKWTQIASQLPGRTENSVKNRWNVHIRKSKKRRDSKANGSVLPSMTKRPPEPQLSPIRLNERVTPSCRSATMLSSLGPDAPHNKFARAKGLPTLGSSDRFVPDFNELEAAENNILEVSVLPSMDLTNGSASKSSKRIFHHQKNRPPSLLTPDDASSSNGRGAFDDEHIFKMPTPRDPLRTPGTDGSFFALRLTPRSTRPLSASSSGSSRDMPVRELSDAKVERMANEFVAAESRRREVIRGIKLSDAERAMMKRAFIAGLRNPTSIVSPSATHSAGDVLQWDFDPAESLDTMGFSFEEDALDNVVVDPITDVAGDKSRKAKIGGGLPSDIHQTVAQIEPIALHRPGAKWPAYEPEEEEEDVEDMSLSMLSMSLEDSVASHEVDYTTVQLLSGQKITQAFNAKKSPGILSPT